MKARKFFSLKHDYPPASTREERRGGATSGATPNDSDVVHVDLHHGNMLAKFILKQNFVNSEARLGEGAENPSRTDIRVRDACATRKTCANLCIEK